MSKTITRSTVNSQDYAAPEFPKSGFNLSYRDYNDYMLGRWHVSGHQYVMPSDKFSGNNKGNFTFNRIVTPMVAPTHVGQYNVYCTLRSIDNTFQENVAPSKYNGYSSEWSMPMVDTRTLVGYLLGTEYDWSNLESPVKTPKLRGYGLTNPTLPTSVEGVYTSFIGILTLVLGDQGGLILDSATVADILQEYTDNEVSVDDLKTYLKSNIFHAFGSTGALYLQAKDMYCLDALEDIKDFIVSRFGENFENVTASTLWGEFMYNLLDVLLTPFVGRYSYFADFGYNYLRPDDLYRIAYRKVVNDQYEITDILDVFDGTPCCEYALRAMYAFWYDRCRDVNLQPVSSTLPKPRQFGSTSIFDLTAGGNLMYLLYRIRRWTEDMFISAQCDSPARHVFAPIYSRQASATVGTETEFASSDQEKITGSTITFKDSITGIDKSVYCPLPSAVNDALSHLYENQVDLDYVLPLQSLRQAQAAERYLKRLDYFGDEYNDYMLSQYNSRVSDLRINHPEILSQSIDDANYEQQVSNVSTSAGSQVGDRTATGTLKSGGDGYSTFAEEFGIVINVITFMPDPTYDGITPQLLMNKLVDLPLPIFAANNDEMGRIMEIASNGLSDALYGEDANKTFMFGHYPAYHAWRSRVDRVRGSFLNERQDCLFRRYYGLDSDGTTPKLNYFFINCRPNLQMFANTVRYDCQLYGDVVHEFYVERVLPTPVETI